MLATRQRSLWEDVAERTSLENYRPRVRDDLTWVRLRTRHGEPYAMVYTPGSAYLRLSEEDDYLAQRMDGTRKVSDLVVDYTERFGRMDFDAVADLVQDLREHDFLSDPPRDVFAALEETLHPPRRRRFAIAQGPVLDLMFPLRGIDGFVTWMHEHGGWLFFTRPALLAGVLITVLGLSACVAEILRGYDPFAPIAGSHVAGILALVAAYIVVTAVHESAHAVTAKHFGGHIPEGGFNLYYFMPGWYVDVTESWLQPWYRRMAVAWAGPYSGFILAGCCCLVVFVLPTGLPATILFKIAIVSYINDAFNLMPLLKMDGYYILTDWLEMPRLRERALAFIAGPLWRALLIDRERLSRREVLYTVFGALAALYSFVSIYFAFAWWGRRLKPIVEPLWRTPGLLAKIFAGAVVAAIAVPLAIGLGRRLWQYQRHLRRAPTVAKQAVETIRIRDRLRLLQEVAFLEGVPEAVAERLARAARVRAVSRGGQVVRQGERGDEFFVVAEGRACVLVRARGEDQVVGHYAAGDFFGERALLGGGVRAATILADTPLKLLVFGKEVFWAELAGPIGWQARVREAIEERQRLHTVPLFAGLGERQLDVLAVKMQVQGFHAGDVLIRQGDPGDAFYVIRAGQVDVVQQEGRSRRRLATLKPGDYFGEMALLRDQPRMATVTGKESGSVWRLGRQDFRDLVGRYLELEGQIARVSESRIPRTHSGRRRR
ncbi:MAG TPA: cyclic nucleotide-binding domain-containing protein [Candidatus Limnocylindrales bacterium]|nr:cyclic nucleotide-binding domain-containing protein [Candidatus Limnocylindrales bacterium]